MVRAQGAQCGPRGSPEQEVGSAKLGSPQASPSLAVKWGEALRPRGRDGRSRCVEQTLGGWLHVPTTGHGPLQTPTALGSVPGHCQGAEPLELQQFSLEGPSRGPYSQAPGPPVWLSVASLRPDSHSMAPRPATDQEVAS